jgi:hypothetical protein
MKKVIALICIGLMHSCSEPAKTSEWTYLFDGTSLDGWRAYNGEGLPPGWAVVDSLMTFKTEFISESDYDYKGSRDLIYGAKEFENFELYVEWKIPPGGNSGIFYHIKEGYSGIPEVAPEYQLIDDLHYTDFHDIEDYNRSIGITDHPENLQPIQSTGADYGMYTPKEGKTLHPAGLWNSTTIRFTPEKVTYYLNGEVMLDFVPWSEDWNQRKNEGKWGMAKDYGKYKKGFIGLQDHGSELWFKTVKIKEL